MGDGPGPAPERHAMACWEFALVFGHFLACFNALGFIYSFGNWIPALLEEFAATNAATNLVSGLLLAGWTCGGIPAMRLLKGGGFRRAYLGGGWTGALAILGVSFAPSGPTGVPVAACLVACAGMGLMVAWNGSASLIPRHLPRREATIYQAFAVTGSGVGTVFWAAMARSLLPLGWRVGLRVVAGLLAGLYAVGAIAQYEPPAPPQKAQGDKPQQPLYTRPIFVAFCAGCMCGGTGYFLPFTVQGVHAANQGLSADDTATIYSVFGVVSILGRLLAGVFGVRWNPLKVWMVGGVGCAASVAGIALATELWHFLVANALLGVSSGPLIALMVPAMLEIVSLERLPEGLMYVFLAQGLGVLASPSLAGQLADGTGSYVAGILVGAGFLVCAAALFGLVYHLKQREVARAAAAKAEADVEAGVCEVGKVSAAGAAREGSDASTSPPELAAVEA